MSFKSCQLVVVVTCFTVQLLMVSGMPSSAVIRRKRSDDGGPLEAVVEHLSQQLSSLDAQQTSVNSEITALKTQTGQNVVYVDDQLCFDIDRDLFKFQLHTSFFVPSTTPYLPLLSLKLSAVYQNKIKVQL